MLSRARESDVSYMRHWHARDVSARSGTRGLCPYSTFEAQRKHQDRTLTPASKAVPGEPLDRGTSLDGRKDNFLPYRSRGVYGKEQSMKRRRPLDAIS